MQKKKNLLAEEDEVDFISCCDPNTVKFVIPPKKYKLNVLIHALLAGPMGGLGLWYLLPTTLNSLFYNNTGKINIYVLSPCIQISTRVNGSTFEFILTFCHFCRYPRIFVKKH